MNKDLYDKQGSFIGSIRDEGEYLELCDANGFPLGRYDKTTDETLDAGGSYVGKGNLLTTLL